MKMPPHSLPRLNLARGLALAGATLVPASASAIEEREPAFGVGLYAGASFGGGESMRFSFGAQARYTSHVYDAFACEPNGHALGGVGRIDFPRWNRPRLVFGAIATKVADSMHGTLEAGVGLRLIDPGFDAITGLQLGASFLSARVDYTWNRNILQTTGGLAAADEWIRTTCYVEGRPWRDDAGHPRSLALLAEAPTAASPNVRAATAVWSERARAEWASVPAFLELAEQLHVVNAPRQLVRRALQAAADEVHHTELAIGVARSLGGGQIVLEPFHQGRPPLFDRGAALARLATESWLDGCLNEGIAASVARLESHVSQHPHVRAVASRIARDEAAHARLAWDILAFALSAGGPDVRASVRMTAREWQAPAPAYDGPGADGALEALGCGSDALKRCAISRVVEHAMPRLQSLLAA